MIKQLSWFIAVGCAAAATHWLAVIILVRQLAFHPLWANLGGWLIAFAVSFSGHYFLTFRYQHKTLAVALQRFFTVSLTGFLINEGAYAILLWTTSISFDILLAIILVSVAVGTYIVSRTWAFRHTPDAS